MTAHETVLAFWSALEARNWRGVEALLAPGFRAEWPQSGEIFDRSGFVEVNRRYPGDWHIMIVTVIGATDAAVSEVEVAIDGRVDRAVSFFRIDEGHIVHLREFWPDPMVIPDWRRELALSAH